MDIKVFESFLEKYQLNKKYYTLKLCEDDLKGELNPVVTLNTLFWNKKKLLTLQEFVTIYWQQFGEIIKQKFPHCTLEHLTARLYRTQVSVYTEYHAILLIKSLINEYFPNLKCIKSNILDVMGIDCIIYDFLKRQHNIHIYVKSKRGNYFRNYKKNYKETDSLSGIHVDFPYTISGKDCIYKVRFLKNGFGVYKEEYCRHLLKKIQGGFFVNCQKNSKKVILNCEGYICS
jgi:hypothetical protein